MINLGLIGCGRWGKNHLRTLREIDEANLKRICDYKTPKIKIFKGTTFTTNYKDILEDKSIKGIIISTPTTTHYSLAKEFLEAEKNVLVEKPMTTSSKEAKNLCKIADKKGVLLMVGEVFRFNPAVRFLKDLIDMDELGELRYIESRRIGLGPIRNDVSVLWDLATHDIYMSNLFVDKKPDFVSYNGISHNGKLDDISYLSLKYTNPEVLSTIYVNWEHPIKERVLTIGGTKKAVCFNDIEPSEKIIIYDRGVDYHPNTGDFGEFQAATRDGNIIIPKLNLIQPLELELKHFIRCIEKKEKCLSDGYAGLETVKVLEAAEESRKKDGLAVKVK